MCTWYCRGVWQIISCFASSALVAGSERTRQAPAWAEEERCFPVNKFSRRTLASVHIHVSKFRPFGAIVPAQALQSGPKLSLLTMSLQTCPRTTHILLWRVWSLGTTSPVPLSKLVKITDDNRIVSDGKPTNLKGQPCSLHCAFCWPKAQSRLARARRICGSCSVVDQLQRKPMEMEDAKRIQPQNGQKPASPKRCG
jgi:hypothetical protein